MSLSWIFYASNNRGACTKKSQALKNFDLFMLELRGILALPLETPIGTVKQNCATLNSCQSLLNTIFS